MNAKQILTVAIQRMAHAVSGQLNLATWDPRKGAKGVDLSHWNGKIDCDKLAGSDLDFIFVKATEGDNFVDPQFRHTWSGLRGRKLRGAYHFFRPRIDARRQADHYIAQVHTDQGEIVPSLDVEVWDGLGPAAVGKAAQEWNGRVRANLSIRRPLILYTNYSFAQALAPYLDLDTWELWLAWPDATPYVWPATPKGWKKPALFWQWSWTTGGYPGIADQTVDANYFRGDRAAFLDWVGVAPSEPPEPDPEPPAGDDEMKTVFLPLVNNQNIRSGPGTNYPSIGKIKIGQELYPARGACIKNAGEVWLRFDEGWVAAVHGGRQYLQAK